MMNSKFQALKAVAAASALLLSAPGTITQDVCAPRDKTKLQLEKQFSEQVAGRGLAANGKHMLELFVSESGSSTMPLSETEGRSCVATAGEAWHENAPAPGDPA